MANILLKGINQELHNQIKARAALEHKKIQVLLLEFIEEAMAEPEKEALK